MALVEPAINKRSGFVTGIGTQSRPLADPDPVLTPLPEQITPTYALPKNWVGEKIYTFDTLFGSKGTGLNELNGPEGICVGSDDTLYIADTQNNRIQVWSCDGQPLKTFGSYGPSAVWRNEPQFDHPAGVLALPNGKIYVADTLNHRIGFWTLTGWSCRPGEGRE